MTRNEITQQLLRTGRDDPFDILVVTVAEPAGLSVRVLLAMTHLLRDWSVTDITQCGGVQERPGARSYVSKRYEAVCECFPSVALVLCELKYTDVA